MSSLVGVNADPVQAAQWVKERRARLLWVSVDILPALFRGELSTTNLPQTSYVQSVHFNHERQGFDLVVYHNSFEKVLLGAVIPRHAAEVQK